VTETGCISLLYMVWGFWGKNRPSAANGELRKTLKPQGQSKRAPPGQTPFLNYKTVALPLSYAGAPERVNPLSARRQRTLLHPSCNPPCGRQGAKVHGRYPTKFQRLKINLRGTELWQADKIF